jgi:hypothetical protein
MKSQLLLSKSSFFFHEYKYYSMFFLLSPTLVELVNFREIKPPITVYEIHEQVWFSFELPPQTAAGRCPAPTPALLIYLPIFIDAITMVKDQMQSCEVQK